MVILLFIIVTLLICICLSLSQLVWIKDISYLKNKYKNQTGMRNSVDNQYEDGKGMYTNFYANVFWSTIFAGLIFLLLYLIDTKTSLFPGINIF